MQLSGDLFCIKTDDTGFMRSGNHPDDCKESGLILNSEFGSADFAGLLHVFHQVTRNEIILIVPYEYFQEFLGPLLRFFLVLTG